MTPVGIVSEYCPACRKKLKSIAILLVHMQSMHWRNKPLTCKDCGAKHYDSTALSRCKKRHQGMHRCYVPECRYKSRSMADVRAHLKSAHGVVNPQDDRILFDRSLAKADPPKTKLPSSFLRYRTMTKSELIAESARVRHEEESRVPGLPVQEVAVASREMAASGCTPNNSHCIGEAHGTNTDARSNVPPTSAQGSRWALPVISRGWGDDFRSTPSLYPTSSTPIWNPASGAEPPTTLCPPPDGIGVDRHDATATLWPEFSSPTSTPAGTETTMPLHWTILPTPAAYAFSSSLFPNT